MSVASFCRAVQSRWQAFAQLVWPESTEQRTRAEAERLADELARRYRLLVRRRCRVERVRDRLARQQRRIAGLTARAGVADGVPRWELALRVERLHRAAGRTRERLQRHEQAYARQRLAFERRKRLRLALLRGEVVVAESPDVDC